MNTVCSKRKNSLLSRIGWRGFCQLSKCVSGDSDVFSGC